MITPPWLAVTSSQIGCTPLARLFAVAYRSLIMDLHAELRTRGWRDVRPAYGFVLLALQSGPTTSGALSDLLGITKQATSKLVNGMLDAGYLTRTTVTGCPGTAYRADRPRQGSARSRGADLCRSRVRLGPRDRRRRAGAAASRVDGRTHRKWST